MPCVKMNCLRSSRYVFLLTIFEGDLTIMALLVCLVCLVVWKLKGKFERWIDWLDVLLMCFWPVWFCIIVGISLHTDNLYGFMIWVWFCSWFGIVSLKVSWFLGEVGWWIFCFLEGVVFFMINKNNEFVSVSIMELLCWYMARDVFSTGLWGWFSWLNDWVIT